MSHIFNGGPIRLHNGAEKFPPLSDNIAGVKGRSTTHSSCFCGDAGGNTPTALIV